MDITINLYAYKILKCASIFVQTDHSVALICKLVYLFIVFGEHGRYIGNINHLWR